MSKKYLMFVLLISILFTKAIAMENSFLTEKQLKEKEKIINFLQADIEEEQNFLEALKEAKVPQNCHKQRDEFLQIRQKQVTELIIPQRKKTIERVEKIINNYELDLALATALQDRLNYLLTRKECYEKSKKSIPIINIAQVAILRIASRININEDIFIPSHPGYKTANETNEIAKNSNTRRYQVMNKVIKSLFNMVPDENDLSRITKRLLAASVTLYKYLTGETEYPGHPDEAIIRYPELGDDPNKQIDLDYIKYFIIAERAIPLAGYAKQYQDLYKTYDEEHENKTKEIQLIESINKNSHELIKLKQEKEELYQKSLHTYDAGYIRITQADFDKYEGKSPTLILPSIEYLIGKQQLIIKEKTLQEQEEAQLDLQEQQLQEIEEKQEKQEQQIIQDEEKEIEETKKPKKKKTKQETIQFKPTGEIKTISGQQVYYPNKELRAFNRLSEGAQKEHQAMIGAFIENPAIVTNGILCDNNGDSHYIEKFTHNLNMVAIRYTSKFVPGWLRTYLTHNDQTNIWEVLCVNGHYDPKTKQFDRW